MADALTLDLVTPEQLLFSKEVEMVVVPGEEGDMGILAGHAPVISSLRTGKIEIYEKSSVSESVFVAGGFVEITPERCTILAEEAVNLNECSRADAEGRLKEAKKQLELAETDHEKQRAEAAIATAEALLESLS